MFLLVLMLMPLPLVYCTECGVCPNPCPTCGGLEYSPSVGDKCATIKCAFGYPIFSETKAINQETNAGWAKQENFNRELACTFDGSRNVWRNDEGSVTLYILKQEIECREASLCTIVEPLRSDCRKGSNKCDELKFKDQGVTKCDGIIEYGSGKQHTTRIECNKMSGKWYATETTEYQPLPRGTNAVCIYPDCDITKLFPTTDQCDNANKNERCVMPITLQPGMHECPADYDMLYSESGAHFVTPRLQVVLCHLGKLKIDHREVPPTAVAKCSKTEAESSTAETVSSAAPEAYSSFTSAEVKEEASSSFTSAEVKEEASSSLTSAEVKEEASSSLASAEVKEGVALSTFLITSSVLSVSVLILLIVSIVLCFKLRRVNRARAHALTPMSSTMPTSCPTSGGYEFDRNSEKKETWENRFSRERRRLKSAEPTIPDEKTERKDRPRRFKRTETTTLHTSDFEETEKEKEKKVHRPNFLNNDRTTTLGSFDA